MCKTVSKEAQPLSFFQVGSRHIQIFLLQFSCNRPLETFFFPLENTKVLLLICIQNRLFFNLLILFSEVSFSRIQVLNSRLWNLSKTTPVSIFSLCLYHALNIWIYANNFLLNRHFWYSGNWTTKKNFLQYTETSFTLWVTTGLQKPTINKNKM